MCDSSSGRSCPTCPFNRSDESEYVQELGCLPTPTEIISLKVATGHNWECHSRPEHPCQGLQQEIRLAKGLEEGYLMRSSKVLADVDPVGGLIRYATGVHLGQHAAIIEATLVQEVANYKSTLAETLTQKGILTHEVTELLQPLEQILDRGKSSTASELATKLAKMELQLHKE